MQTLPYLSFRSSANLIVLEDGVVRSYPLEMLDEWKIGRQTPDKNLDIPLVSKIASRVHGKIINIEDNWYYIDQGSLNGTYYNGTKLTITGKGESNAVQLKNGDTLRIDSDDLECPENRGIWMLFSTESIGNQWETVQLRKNKTIFGRDRESCDVEIPRSYISRCHMVIEKKNNNYYLMDCNSQAGTWLNGAKVHGEVQLKEKDMIAICDCIMVFTGNKVIYNIPIQRKEQLEVKDSAEIEKKNDAGSDNEAIMNHKPAVLKANIVSVKAPSNKGHGKKELIKNVKFEVCEGTLVALLGGTGAGKSTVMNCINGGAKNLSVSGAVEYMGVDLIKNFDRMKALIGSVPQDDVINTEITVEQELRHAAVRRMSGDSTAAEIKERVDKTLEMLGMESKRKERIGKCSGGEKRRVNIGIELVGDGQLLCLDEPDAGLDPGVKTELFKILRSLADKEGKTILTIIHDVSDIDMFDKVIIMNKVKDVGRLAFAGTPAQAREFFGVDVRDVYALLRQEPEKYIMEEN